ncbi:BMP and activin membrane-bound inhibitor homolog (Xenopus laevis) b [Pangasianodon hypophthalmus]|uniref:BMP and activin membrane-bound inhibitor homolog (Xenopus laevis) b n=1 Tax=Pangasianodon hypophthalmus TaxID=310915 RepID=UPI000EFE1151|nr:BMP and activin membrane-bound inhibitor homolog (Xenopus laevis) b [Pangasianodon hypophthalmus]
MERLVSIWLQLELWAMAVLLTRGEIRCYCDSPHCVATGYMCKSELNACFTRILDPQSSKSPLSHGCYEPALNGGSVCRSEATHDALHGPATLECCHEDMCNYRGPQDLTYSQGGSLDHRSRPQAEGGRQIIARVQEIPSAKEVWFRAAVIAVPIAGGLVLVLLITLALRMLRSENQRLRQQRREMLSRLHYGFHGQHLAKSRSTKLDLECMMPLGGHESCCLTCDKIRQSDLSSQRLLSLVHWGRHGPRGKLELV